MTKSHQTRRPLTSPRMITRHRCIIFTLLISAIPLLLHIKWTLHFPRIYLQTLTPPGVIVKVHDRMGVGNQLFRYACSYALAKTYNLPLYLYVPYLNSDTKGLDELDRNTLLKNPKSRLFVLDQFHIPMDNTINNSMWCFEKDLFKITDWHLLHKAYELKERTLNTKLIMHIDNCESEVFFYPYQKEIREMFVPKFKDGVPPSSSHFHNWLHLIKESGESSVAVHIRRGDYLTHGRQYWATPIEYHQRAMQIMVENLAQNNISTLEDVTFFVFSDDIEYAKENLLLNKTDNSSYTELFKNVHFVSSGMGPNATTNLEEFYLMTKCKHMIMANSTFSWWAAYLIGSKRNVIIAPKYNPKFFDHYLTNRLKEFKRFEFTLWYKSDWIVIDPYTL